MPPTLLIHGTWDDLVPVDHSERLAQALLAAGARVQFVKLPLARHAFDVVADSPAAQLAREEIASFLEAGR